MFFFYWHWHLVWLNQHLNVLTSVSLHALRNWDSGVSLRVTQVKFWSNFDFFGSFLWHPGQSWRKHCKSCNTLQHGLKINIYCCKNIIFLALRAGPPPLPRVTEQHPGSPLANTGVTLNNINYHGGGIPRPSLDIEANIHCFQGIATKQLRGLLPFTQLRKIQFTGGPIISRSRILVTARSNSLEVGENKCNKYDRQNI